MIGVRWIAVAVVILGLAPLGWALQISQIEFDLQVEQGGVYTISFLVRNDSERPQTVTVYLGDWDRDLDGTNRFYPPGTVERSLSAWLSVAPAQLTLDPGAAQEITATLTVPTSEEAELSGSYWGIIFVQGQPRPIEQGGTTVMAIERFGVKVYATIAGTAAPAGSVPKLEAVPAEQGFQVIIYYANTGNVHQRVRGTLTVVDRTGTVVEELELPEFPILPGATRRLVVDLPTLPRGVYQLQALMDFGGEVLVAGVEMLRIR